MICLGIESSCDETALALVDNGKLRASVLASQGEIHALFGGVVPELASREHYRYIGPLFDILLQKGQLSIADIDCIAVSRGPGLLGSLLVGVGFAKALAVGLNKPMVGVNHLHAHLLSVGLECRLPFPALGLLVSGGHTHIYRMQSPTEMVLLGRTLDDAAGEAFDKVAKILGLPYPGGRWLDKLAQKGDAKAVFFPRPYTDNDTLDFSFSGLKTAVRTHIMQRAYLLDEIQHADATDTASQELCDVCASFNAAVVDTLRIKIEKALDREPAIQTLVLAGGVAANTLLRSTLHSVMSARQGSLLVPDKALCTDNAAMVAYAGWVLHASGWRHGLDVTTIPRGQKIPDDMQHEQML